MKQWIILLVMVFICLGGGLFAEEAVLIDFSQLAADYPTDNPTEQLATMIDFAEKAGASVDDAMKALMKTSLALQNWDVVLASSSRTILNQSESVTKAVKVRDDAKQYAGDTVLGVRVHFPIESYNSWALVKPPFDIPAYMRKTKLEGDRLVQDDTDLEGTKFDGFGVVKNVGVLKSVTVTVYGSNFPNGMELILKDQNNKVIPIFIGYLEFDGWKTLTWSNSNYIDDVKNRSIVKFPLYPRATPSVKLYGIRFLKDASQEGGDFLCYIKDIKIVFDKAVLDFKRDIDEEAVWGILQKREEARRTFELTRLGNLQVLRFIEKQKMAQESDTTAAETP